jgi:tetratricopeptide (TPR) repeat protein
VLRTQQGWSPDPQQDALRALECTKQALDADPDCSLALAVDGLVQTHFLKRLDLARARYHLAVETNPNDSLAWLLKGTMHAFMGQGHEAVDNTQRALRLSPLDPHRYYYESLAGTACLAAEDYEGALRYALSSIRANRTHTSTWRVATIAMWHLGRHDEAREVARTLLTLEPGLTIERYLARSPAATFDTGKIWSDALRQAGVPD